MNALVWPSSISQLRAPPWFRTLLTIPSTPCTPSLSPPPQKESAGYRLLSAMGWREGEGLGATKQGIKSHIKVKKKFENWGVGAVSEERGSESGWAQLWELSDR